MKAQIELRLLNAVRHMQEQGMLDAAISVTPALSVPKDPSHGDFATNIALQIAKPMGVPPRVAAERLLEALTDRTGIKQIEIAGPGFLNFFVDPAAAFALIDTVLAAGSTYGHSQFGEGKKVQVEFVSANPTGPLHVGHGRGAAYGAVVADLLAAVGFNVHREYYVNDAGRQMHILGVSIWLRYLEACGATLTFPANGYKSEDYIFDIAQALKTEHGETLVISTEDVFTNLPPDEPQGGDKDVYIDTLIERAKTLLGETRYRTVFDAGLNSILADIRDDLREFGVEYEQWYSEQTLEDRGLIDRAIAKLEERGHIYEKEGALWFKSTDFGDDKDRVVRRDNGQSTYFASDIAYHMEKFERGFERVIDIWGADHHGYVPRVKAALTALGFDASKLDVSLVQFAILYRGGERVQMSTRSGSFVTLRELRKEVGDEAARFFYIMRAAAQHLDFDLDLAKSQSNDNPLYYIQYAHARVCSVFRQLPLRGFVYDAANGRSAYARLTESHEQALFKRLSQFSDTVQRAAVNLEPHLIVHYLRDLAQDFHAYYNAHAFLVADDAPLRDARLNLVAATRQVLANGLALLGMSAPEEM